MNSSLSQELFAIIAITGAKDKRGAATALVEARGGRLRDHTGVTEAGTNLALFRSVEDAAEFALEAQLFGGLALALVIGEVNAGDGRNVYLDAAAILAGRARPGELLLTDHAADLLRAIDAADFEMQFLGPQEITGLKRTVTVFRSGHAETAANADGASTNPAVQTSKADMLLMLARDEAQRQREQSRRNMRLATACIIGLFIIAIILMFVSVNNRAHLNDEENEIHEMYPMIHQQMLPLAENSPSTRGFFLA